ncbi:MAG: BatD family protein, partial [bacterium]
MKRICTALVFIAVFAAAAAAADTAVIAKASTDKQEVKLGERLKYTISVSRKGSISSSPRVSPPEFNGFRVGGSHSSSSINIINNNSSVTQNLQYELIAVERGDITIPPAEVTFLNPETDTYESIKTKPVTIKVISEAAPKKTARERGKEPTPTETAVPPPSRSEFREIKLSLDLRPRDILLYALMVIAAIAAVIIIFRFISRKKNRADVVSAPLDYKKEALKKLENAKKRLDKGEVKLYYFALYEAVRFYLSRRFKISFEESTTREIVSALKKAGAAAEDISIINDFLHEC